ncbi:hypothetical protein J4457_06090 [Candidatus Woesearchaeota archaeon]|nr:hypothetical protein [Candidatus Woesearchaeota archaeon]
MSDDDILRVPGDVFADVLASCEFSAKITGGGIDLVVVRLDVDNRVAPGGLYSHEIFLAHVMTPRKLPEQRTVHREQLARLLYVDSDVLRPFSLQTSSGSLPNEVDLQILARLAKYLAVVGDVIRTVTFAPCPELVPNAASLGLIDERARQGFVGDLTGVNYPTLIPLTNATLERLASGRPIPTELYKIHDRPNALLRL